MKLLALHRLTGPNVYSMRSAVVVHLDTQGQPTLPARALRRHAARLPESAGWHLIRSALDRVARQGEVVHCGALIGTLAAALEEERFQTDGRAVWLRPAGADGLIDVIVETGDVDVTSRAAVVAIEVCELLWVRRDPAADAAERVAARLNLFWQNRSNVRFRWTTSVLVAAARKLDVPVAKLLPERPFAILGQGCRSKRLSEAMTDDVSAVAATLSKDKITSSEILRQQLLPVPPQRIVSSEADVEQAIRSLGLPVVVKGRSTDKGTSVTVNVRSRDELRRAIAKVRALGDQVIIQRHIAGDDFRITVAYGEVLAAARRVSAHVIGDGSRSVTALIEQTNRARRSSGPYGNWYTPLEISEESRAMLATAGLHPESIPEPGQRVCLAGTANISTGGTAVDVTDEVHPSIIAQCERIAAVFGLSIVGIDVITTDIRRPLAETGGVFIEVNATPGLRPHYLTDRPRDIAAQIIGKMFPGADRGRIPTVGVTGTNGKTTVCRMTTAIFEAGGSMVGSSTTGGMKIGGDVLVRADSATGAAAQALLRDPRVEVGVFELARGGILKRGLHLEDLEVGVVTNITNDHVGQDGIGSLEELVRIKRLVVERARKAVVLNADDAHCVEMRSHVSAPVWWVSGSADNPIIVDHVASGGSSVVLCPVDGNDTLVLQRGGERTELIAAADIPATLNGIAGQNVENALFAAAVTLALDVPMEQVKSALARFDSSVQTNPGRLNIREVDGVRLIYDYVHNVSGMQRLGETLEKMPVDGRRLCMLVHDGKRDDAFYRDYTRVAAGLFDHFVVAEDMSAGSRAEGEVLRLLLSGLESAGVAGDRLRSSADIDSAVDDVYAMARPGDLVLLTGGLRRPMWEALARFALGPSSAAKKDEVARR